MSEVAHTGGACTGHLYRTTYSKVYDGLQAFLLQPQEPSFNMDTTAPVDEYQLTFTTEKDSVVQTGDRTLNSTTTTFLLTDLKMGAVYTITVVAINTAGPGASSEVIQATNIDRKLVGKDCTWWATLCLCSIPHSSQYARWLHWYQS